MPSPGATDSELQDYQRAIYGAIEGLGAIATMDSAARQRLAARITTTSFFHEISVTRVYVKVSGGLSIPGPPPSTGAAARDVAVTDFGAGVTKAVVESHVPATASLQALGLSIPAAGPPVVVLQVQRLDDQGGVISGAPFKFSVPADGLRALTVYTYSAASTSGTDIVSEGGSVTREGPDFVVVLPHTSVVSVHPAEPLTQSVTATHTQSVTATHTQSVTATHTQSVTATHTQSAASTPTETASLTPTEKGPAPHSASATATRTPTATAGGNGLSTVLDGPNVLCNRFACAPCVADVAGCQDISVSFRTGADAHRLRWIIYRAGKPASVDSVLSCWDARVGADRLLSNAAYTGRLCLVPGLYNFAIGANVGGVAEIAGLDLRTFNASLNISFAGQPLLQVPDTGFTQRVVRFPFLHAGDCSVPNRDVPGCIELDLSLYFPECPPNTGCRARYDRATSAGWHIEGSCPPASLLDGSLAYGNTWVFRLCLAPGSYGFQGIWKDFGWPPGTSLTVTFPAYLDKVLVPATEFQFPSAALIRFAVPPADEIATLTASPTPSATPVPTRTSLPTATPTPLPTPTPSSTHTPSSSATALPTITATPLPTHSRPARDCGFPFMLHVGSVGITQFRKTVDASAFAITSCAPTCTVDNCRGYSEARFKISILHGAVVAERFLEGAETKFDLRVPCLDVEGRRVVVEFGEIVYLAGVVKVAPAPTPTPIASCPAICGPECYELSHPQQFDVRVQEDQVTVELIGATGPGWDFDLQVPCTSCIDPCEGRGTKDVPGCQVVVVSATSGVNGIAPGWRVEEACPAAAQIPYTFGRAGRTQNASLCLRAGDYNVTATADGHGGDWRGAALTVFLAGSGAVLAPATPVRPGGGVAFSLASATPQPTVAPTATATATATPSPTPLPTTTYIRSVPTATATPTTVPLSGRLYLFGRNDWGQLGLGDRQDRSVPHVMMDPAPGPRPRHARVLSAALGLEHSGFIDATGAAWVFGRNTRMQLGSALTAWGPKHAAPATPGGSAGPARPGALEMALGDHHSLLVRLGSDGWTVLSWGASDEGQLARSWTSAALDQPNPETVSIKGGVQWVPPKELKPLHVAAGGSHTAVLYDDHRLFVAGRNAEGQLGLGHAAPRDGLQEWCRCCGAAAGGTCDTHAPALCDGVCARTVTAVSLGGRHSAVIAGGGLWVFGANDRGQLGLGHRNGVAVPTPLDWPGPIEAVAVGHDSSSFIAAGRLYVFGGNNYGQLGLGDRLDRLRPAPLAAPNGAVVTAAQFGRRHGGLLAGGELFVFGEGSRVDAPNPLVPAHVRSPTSEAIRDFAIGGDTTAFIVGATGTPTLTATASPTATPTASATGSPTATPVPTATATASLTPEGTASPSATGTGTATRTPVPTGTATATSTPSATASAAHSSTPTPTITRTAPLVPCVQSAGDTLQTQGTLVLDVAGKCKQAATMGQGSSTLQSRKLLVKILREGTLSVRLTSGCRDTSPGCPDCVGCVHTYGPKDLGREFLLPLGSVADIAVDVVYEPTAAGAAGRRAARATNTASTVEIAVVHSPSTLFVVLMCIGAAVLVVLVVACVLWQRRRLRRKRQGHVEWSLSRATDKAKEGKFWVQLVFTCLACVMAVAVAWCLTVVLGSSMRVFTFSKILAPVILAGVTGLLLLVFVFWAFYDPQQHHCTVCQEKVSRWRFVGTYLPPLEGSDVPRKAHTRHVRCMRCNRIVVTGGWAHAPLGRPYHAECWQVCALRAFGLWGVESDGK